ncbi:MAG: hypothetical protein V4773_24100 [Verrucomicrobiota bacterium]
MSSAQQIRLNQLLLEREAQFVRVYDLEQAAAAILGEPYPFIKPPLPSDARGKKKPSAPRAGARDRLRRLEDGETAYRVTYRQFERTLTEEHDDLDALRTLLAAQGAQLQVLRIETLDTGGSPKEALFERGSATP